MGHGAVSGVFVLGPGPFSFLSPQLFLPRASLPLERPTDRAVERRPPAAVGELVAQGAVRWGPGGLGRGPGPATRALPEAEGTPGQGSRELSPLSGPHRSTAKPMWEMGWRRRRGGGDLPALRVHPAALGRRPHPQKVATPQEVFKGDMSSCPGVPSNRSCHVYFPANSPLGSLQGALDLLKGTHRSCQGSFSDPEPISVVVGNGPWGRRRRVPPRADPTPQCRCAASRMMSTLWSDRGGGWGFAGERRSPPMIWDPINTEIPPGDNPTPKRGNPGITGLTAFWEEPNSSHATLWRPSPLVYRIPPPSPLVIASPLPSTVLLLPPSALAGHQRAARGPPGPRRPPARPWTDPSIHRVGCTRGCLWVSVPAAAAVVMNGGGRWVGISCPSLGLPSPPLPPSWARGGGG